MRNPAHASGVRRSNRARTRFAPDSEICRVWGDQMHPKRRCGHDVPAGAPVLAAPMDESGLRTLNPYQEFSACFATDLLCYIRSETVGKAMKPVEAIHRKLRGLGVVVKDAAATEHERAT